MQTASPSRRSGTGRLSAGGRGRRRAASGERHLMVSVPVITPGWTVQMKR
jgi:hypothetical protein